MTRKRIRLGSAGWAVVLSLLFLMSVFPGMAGAHASLVKASPEPDSQSDDSPQRIVLTFNERLEGNVFYIKVVDEIGRSVTGNKTALNQSRTTLTLELPKLNKGNYIVSYHVISADGHPIDSSYVFTVGPPRGSAGGGLATEQHHHELSWNAGMSDLLKHGSRILYYFSLLTMTGWVLVITFFSGGSGEDRTVLRGWSLNLQRLHLLALLILIFYHFPDLIGTEGGFAELIGLFTGTTVGISWIVSFALALLGFVVLLRSRLINIVWVAAVLAAKSVSGHAMAHDPPAVALLLDWVHLAAAAFWSGGLLTALVMWKRPDFRKAYLPFFSRYALLSLCLLIVTGSITTLLYVPKLNYLLYTQWGLLLLVKIGLALLVVAAGAVIRYLTRRGKTQATGLTVRVDALLMALIIGLVGLLTYVAPIPSNEPLNWHVMGEKVHTTVRITPNAPGANTFIVKAWLPEKLGEPKNVELRLIYNDDKSIAPLTVPIAPFVDKEIEVNFGYSRYSYKAAGPYLPLAGGWTVQVRVLDANDDETVYEHNIRLF